MKLPPLNTLKVSVVDRVLGEPLPGMRVWWRTQSSSAQRVLNAATKTAAFHEVPREEEVEVGVGFSSMEPLMVRRVVMPAEGPRELTFDVVTELMGSFKEKDNADFKPVDADYLVDKKRTIYLREKTRDAFVRMHTAAKTAGISLKVMSGTRNFAYQKDFIWEKKWSGRKEIYIDDGDGLKLVPPKEVRRLIKEEKTALLASYILQYSLMPGTSRHHWGTDLDINSDEKSYWKKNPGLAEHKWLRENAATYGFAQPYTAGRTGGCHEEKWHWSYTPLSRRYLALYEKHVGYDDIKITGFSGSNKAEELDVIKSYVMNVDSSCAPLDDGTVSVA